MRGQEKKGQETRETTLEAVYISCEYLLFANTCFQFPLQTKEKTREGWWCKEEEEEGEKKREEGREDTQRDLTAIRLVLIIFFFSLSWLFGLFHSLPLVSLSVHRHSFLPSLPFQASFLIPNFEFFLWPRRVPLRLLQYTLNTLCRLHSVCFLFWFIHKKMKSDYFLRVRDPCPYHSCNRKDRETHAKIQVDGKIFTELTLLYNCCCQKWATSTAKNYLSQFNQFELRKHQVFTPLL